MKRLLVILMVLFSAITLSCKVWDLVGLEYGSTTAAIPGTTSSTPSGTTPSAIPSSTISGFVFVANKMAIGGISMYTINASTGALTANGNTYPVGTNLSAFTVDPSGKFIYVTCQGSNDVSMYTINASTGLLTANGTIAAGTGPISVTVDPTGRYAYVANVGAVSMYTINSSTGVLTANVQGQVQAL